METEENRFVAECSTYDFKRELDRKKKNSWLKSVSAFANTNGGSLYFGVDNNGQAIGLTDAQSDTEFISEAINAYLDPIPIFSINPQKGENGKIFLDLNVPAGKLTPYYVNTDGRKMAYVRSGEFCRFQKARTGIPPRKAIWKVLILPRKITRKTISLPRKITQKQTELYGKQYAKQLRQLLICLYQTHV